MRNWFWAFVVLCFVLLVYSAWPLAGAAQMAAVAETGAPDAVMQRVDLPALRRSLAHQIVAAYLRQNEKLNKMTGIARSLAGSVGTTVADSMLQDLLTPDSITAILKDGRFGGRSTRVASSMQLPRVGSIMGGQGIATLLNSYFDGPTSFVVPIAGGETYWVHLRLTGTTWVLSGLDLPTSLVDRLAREVAARQKNSA